MTRRELAALLGAGTLACRMGGTAVGGQVRRAGVVGLAELAAAGDGVDPQAARRAVRGAVAAATGTSTGIDGARSLFRSEDTVGIKVNCLAGRRLSPRVELVEALVELLVEAGVPGHRIVVFERSSSELRQAGFEVRRKGGRYLCYGIDNDWDRLPTSSGAIGSCYARLVSSTCTALVSFGVVKDHDLAGVSAGLKNWYGVIHNPNKYHDNCCDPYVADVVRHAHVGPKLRLTILDGVRAQCHGGPAFLAAGLFELGQVAASTDPVAADVWAWQVIDAERRRRGLPTLAEEERPPRFLSTAAEHGLGVADPNQIKRVMS